MGTSTVATFHSAEYSRRKLNHARTFFPSRHAQSMMHDAKYQYCTAARCYRPSLLGLLGFSSTGSPPRFGLLRGYILTLMEVSYVSCARLRREVTKLRWLISAHGYWREKSCTLFYLPGPRPTHEMNYRNGADHLRSCIGRCSHTSLPRDTAPATSGAGSRLMWRPISGHAPFITHIPILQ